MELSFAIGISVILGGLVAGAGSYLTNQSHGQTIRQHMSLVDAAVQKYIQHGTGAGGKAWPLANPFLCCSVLYGFLPKVDGYQEGYYLNPYTNIVSAVIAGKATAADTFPTDLSPGGVVLDSNSFPLNGADAAHPDRRGRIFYLYNDFDAYQQGQFIIYSSGPIGFSKVSQYALMAIDDQGWPLATIVH